MQSHDRWIMFLRLLCTPVRCSSFHSQRIRAPVEARREQLLYDSSWSRNRSTDHAYILEEDNAAARERRTSTPDVVEPEEHGRDDPQEDDPYEYDDDIRPTTSGMGRCDVDSDVEDDEECLSLFEAANYLVSGTASTIPTTKVGAPCWGCKSCAVEGLPLFLLGSPTEASRTCASCQ